MDYKDVEKVLTKNDWVFVREKGSHRMFKHPILKGTVTVPFHGHRDLTPKVLKSIEKQAGLSLQR